MKSDQKKYNRILAKAIGVLSFLASMLIGLLFYGGYLKWIGKFNSEGRCLYYYPLFAFGHIAAIKRRNKEEDITMAAFLQENSVVDVLLCK